MTSPVGELYSIVTLIRDHREWIHLYPDRYENALKTGTGMFLNFIQDRTGIRITSPFYEIPVEKMALGTLEEAVRIAQGIRRELLRAQLKTPDPKRVQTLEAEAEKWRLIAERLRKAPP